VKRRSNAPFLIILIVSFIDPDAVVLLPWNPDAYELSHPFPLLLLQIVFISLSADENLAFTFLNVSLTLVMVRDSHSTSASNRCQPICRPISRNPTFTR